MTDIFARFEKILESYPAMLSGMDEKELSLKATPDRWSKKEIIGHLIDSAANNHQRFVRAQFEEDPFIKYDQDSWVDFNYYQQRNIAELIRLWEAYNQSLLALIKFIPDKYFKKTVRNGSPHPVTLEFIIHDYVHHLEHHLKQII